jgi:hypothetical protein
MVALSLTQMTEVERQLLPVGVKRSQSIGEVVMIPKWGMTSNGVYGDVGQAWPDGNRHRPDPGSWSAD